ncbi:hypothetical protein Trydic_g16289 [Trypoxylus dichotomus]
MLWPRKSRPYLSKYSQGILKNDTWQLMARPSNQEEKGFSQKPEIHFNETFAPVARLSTIRILMTLAVRFDMPIRQFDVATAYLNGKLKEEIFMEPPKLFKEILEDIAMSEAENTELKMNAMNSLEKLSSADIVCGLNKSLYGLRQAGKTWHSALNNILKSYGAKPTTSDPCLYYMRKGRKLILIATYVDDIVIASSNPKDCIDLGKYLSTKFEVKDLGEIRYCLGIEFKRTENLIMMVQSSYIKEILKHFEMTDCKPISTPMEADLRLVKPSDNRLEELKLPYRELVGTLTYLAVSTRPEISFAMSCLAQFNNCYRQEHWSAAKHVLRYLKGSMNLGIVHKPNSDPIKGYVDADWVVALMIEDRIRDMHSF